jgi:phosphate starvation-inducible membrane PsiE
MPDNITPNFLTLVVSSFSSVYFLFRSLRYIFCILCTRVSIVNYIRQTYILYNYMSICVMLVCISVYMFKTLNDDS